MSFRIEKVLTDDGHEIPFFGSSAESDFIDDIYAGKTKFLITTNILPPWPQLRVCVAGHLRPYPNA